jgi:hypothetical protein
MIVVSNFSVFSNIYGLWFYGKFDNYNYSIWWAKFSFYITIHFNYGNYDKITHGNP